LRNITNFKSYCKLNVAFKYKCMYFIYFSYILLDFMSFLLFLKVFKSLIFSSIYFPGVPMANLKFSWNREVVIMPLIYSLILIFFKEILCVTSMLVFVFSRYFTTLCFVNFCYNYIFNGKNICSVTWISLYRTQ
jgi:hypothetical protein